MADLLIERPAFSRLDTQVSDFERELLQGLDAMPKRISPKYFYDAAGSALFDRICALPEYYPTRTERGILSEHGEAIAAHIGSHADIIEFGAGSLSKIRSLLDAFGTARAPARYLPVDISGEHLEHAARQLRAIYPDLVIQPIVADYTSPLAWPDVVSTSMRRAGFFPGSTLGNFDPDDALAFLTSTAQLLRGGGLLLGVDLIKDPAVLHAAYNDSKGVTAAFNLNVLHRANRELGTNFALDGYFHHAFYDPVRQRVEMHLVSKRPQVVELGDQRIEFRKGETIHTESSYKYTVDGLRNLARRAGFTPGPVWQDRDGLFSVHWLEAPTH